MTIMTVNSNVLTNIPNNMKEMFSTMNKVRKNDPKEFWGSVAYVVLSFTFLITLMWVSVIFES